MSGIDQEAVNVAAPVPPCIEDTGDDNATIGEFVLASGAGKALIIDARPYKFRSLSACDRVVLGGINAAEPDFGIAYGPAVTILETRNALDRGP
jgi:hypothetical protein